jgi:DNA-binding CsgD family transcriptional regulator
MKPSSAIASIYHLASLGLPAKMTQGTLRLLLEDVFAYDTLTILWLDESCNLIDVASNHLCPRDLGDLFVAHFLNQSEADAYKTHHAFMRHKSSHDVLHKQVANYRETEFYNEFARPMDFHFIARFALRNAGDPLAAIWATRTRGTTDFSNQDIRQLVELLPCLEQMLAVSSVGIDESCTTPSGEQAWLLVDIDGSVSHLASGTAALLHLAANVPRNASSLSDDCYDWARPILKRLLDQLVQLESQTQVALPTATIINQSGHYIFRAYRMEHVTGHRQTFGVQITRHVPIGLRLLASPMVRALPRREKQVCLMLAEGEAPQIIAKQMGISSNAVIQHVRSIYSRLNINRREELLNALLPTPESRPFPIRLEARQN